MHIPRHVGICRIERSCDTRCARRRGQAVSMGPKCPRPAGTPPAFTTAGSILSRPTIHEMSNHSGAPGSCVAPNGRRQKRFLASHRMQAPGGRAAGQQIGRAPERGPRNPRPPESSPIVRRSVRINRDARRICMYPPHGFAAIACSHRCLRSRTPPADLCRPRQRGYTDGIESLGCAVTPRHRIAPGDGEE